MLATASDRALLQPYLLSGERVLWSGRPRRGLRVTRGGCATYAFGVVFLAFALFWTVASYALGGNLWFSAFGIPFILVGLYLCVFKPVLGITRSGRTVYAVTDRRVLRLVGTQMRSMELENLPPITLNECGDRSGDILFGESWTRERPGFDGPAFDFFHRLGAIPSLDRIDDVRQLYELLRRESARHRNQPSS